jgi:hypothetical protein
MFMNVTQPCGRDAYDSEGYCETHLILMLRQEISAQALNLNSLRDAAQAVIDNATMGEHSRHKSVRRLSELLSATQ